MGVFAQEAIYDHMNQVHGSIHDEDVIIENEEVPAQLEAFQVYENQRVVANNVQARGPVEEYWEEQHAYWLGEYDRMLREERQTPDRRPERPLVQLPQLPDAYGAVNNVLGVERQNLGRQPPPLLRPTIREHNAFCLAQLREREERALIQWEEQQRQQQREQEGSWCILM
ncbi:hypothetical protein VKT23_011015 [Stygiomarasmius scandens]|uniref:Uncharacterized protein n=1 Tax=Marasmiellus scandens TaxID=2682957 RepID=A0ABR1JAJ7_9AGAR